MEKIKKIMLISVCLMFIAMTIEPPKIKVYLIMSYRDSHNYSVEERELTE